MNRVPYRRVTPPREGVGYVRTAENIHKPIVSRQPDTPDSISAAQNFVLQLIISGVLMLAVLIICLTDITPLVELRSGLRNVLAGATTPRELVADVRDLGNEWLGFSEPEDYEVPTFYMPDSPFVPRDYPLTVFEETYQTYQEQETPPTADYLPNPHVPGLLVTPGLWD